MAQKMKLREVAGCVVGGRIRDLAELKASGLTVCMFKQLVGRTITTSITSSHPYNRT